MSVLVINGSADLYGSGRILLQVLTTLSPRKVILVVPHKGPLTDIIEHNKEYANIEVIALPHLPLVSRKMATPSGALSVITKMRQAKKSIREIIKTHQVEWAFVNTLACFMPLRILRSLKVKTLLHVHEMLEHDKLLTRSITKYAVAWANKVIAVSDPVRENLFRSCRPADQSKVITVLNGIPDKFAPSFNRANEDNKVVITYFGRIIILKGIWFLLDTIALLPEQVINKCTFKIFGGPAPGGEALIEKLENDIAAHPARNAISFGPFVSDVTEELNKSDVIVVPSLLKDSFPTTVLEALSAGKPVIATNTGGAKQSIDDGVTGFLIHPHAKEQFAEKLTELIINDARRKEMGENARKQFLSRFTLEIFHANMQKEVINFENSINRI